MKRWPLKKAYFWETAPFFRFLIPLVIGIFCYDRGTNIFSSGIICISVLLGTFILLVSVPKKKSRAFSAINFIFYNIFFFFLGICTTYFADIRNNKTWFGNNLNPDNSYLVRISDAPSEKESSWKVPVVIVRCINGGEVMPTCGKAFVYIYKGGAPMLFHKGDSIFTPGNWQLIRNAGNPFEFDYATWCRRNNILYQQSCSINNIRLYAPANPDFAPLADRAHDWCMGQLEKYLPDAKTRGLIQAMLLGDEVNLDEELRQSYSETGIIHIIAISGGNVAIFFMVISWLLWWIRDKKHLWIKYVVALPMVWFYVMMAGAPPSAIRAALMFSLLAGAIIFQKSGNSLNQLFATAFLLLCVQPDWLFSAGFQLSFVAVLSLILFYSPVYNWVAPAHKLLKLIWGAIAASIAAEILVAPIVVYYFHTFPLLFIIANVIAYFFMCLVMILSIAIVVVFFLPVVAKVIGIGTIWLVTFFDGIVSWLQSCNPQSFHFLLLDGVELLLVYVITGGVVLFLFKKAKPVIIVAAGAAYFLLVLSCRAEWRRLYQDRIVAYNNGKTNHIERITGDKYIAISDDTTSARKDYAEKAAHTGWQAWRKDSTPSRDFFYLGGKKVLVLNEDLATTDQFPVDYLILNYNGSPDPAALQKTYAPSLIIIGNNYSRKQQEQFVKKCNTAGIPVHSVSRDGAFVLVAD